MRYSSILNGSVFELAADKDAKEDAYRRLSSLFDSMMKALYRSEGAQLAIDILSTPQIREFIDTHASVLNSSFEQTKMSEGMRRRLHRSNFIFSGMKTFHELNEAFPSILDENGDRKPFERFLNDVRKIDNTYNRNYLRAEYNFIASSAEMAAKWEGFMKDGDNYNLQYRTQKDDKVRPEHAALDGVTLPPSDSFWEEYYPPNGWNCRCTVVQVRKSKYPATPHDEAMRLGQEALQRDTKGIFRFNPGLEQKSVPDYNPYTIRRCRDCDIAKGKQKFAKVFIPDNELCAACELLHKCVADESKSQRAIERTHYLHKMEPLLKKKIKLNNEGKIISVGFSKVGNKHLFSDTFGRSAVLTKEDLHNLDSILANAIYIKEAPNSKLRKDNIVRFYYYEALLHGKKIYLNVAETEFKNDNGKIYRERFLYSVTDSIKNKEP